MILNNNYVLLVCYCLEIKNEDASYQKIKVINLRDTEDLFYSVVQSIPLVDNAVRPNNKTLSTLLLDFIDNYLKNYEVLYEDEKTPNSNINLLIIHRDIDTGKENIFIKNIILEDLFSDNINTENFLEFDNINNDKINYGDMPVHLRIESEKEFKFLLEDNEFKDKPQNFDINAFLI